MLAVTESMKEIFFVYNPSAEDMSPQAAVEQSMRAPKHIGAPNRQTIYRTLPALFAHRFCFAMESKQRQILLPAYELF